MKAIVKCEAKIEGNKITITGELMDVNFPLFVAQRHTISHPVNGNPSKRRHVQANTHGVAVQRNGSDGVLFPTYELAAIATEIDSKLTDAPEFQEHPSKNNLTGKIKSEIPATASIEQSDDGKTWSQVPNAGQDFKGEPGKHYRCVVSNSAGKTVSNPVLIPKPVLN